MICGLAKWKVLSVDNSSPNLSQSVAINNTSIVIQLEYSETKYLFMGDSGEKVEEKLLSDEVLSKVDVLKVGHHRF